MVIPLTHVVLILREKNKRRTMMNDLLKFIKELKDKTGADFVVLGNEGEDGFILAIQKGDFEQHNKMPLDTENTIDSISDSFLQSYANTQDLEGDDE
jgi:microsomal dipeptidase-like Zn-dependent dipeptidase